MRGGRRVLAVTAVGACALALSACGDDEDEPTATVDTTPRATVPAPVTTPPPETAPEQPQRDPDREPRTVPPEEQQGDEEPIRSEAVFTGRGGRLTPREVRVPAFIAIRVILRSSDAGSYELRIGGKNLGVDATVNTDEVDLDGLLPGRAYRGRGSNGNVRVVASAEPGP